MMKLPFRRPLARATAEFYLRRPGNFLLVQGTREGEILVCATADNLTPEQREAFVRYLGAEGFMAGDPAPPGPFHERVLGQEGLRVRWRVDPSWPAVDPSYAWHLRRLCWCTAGTTMVWLALMAVLVCS